MGRNKRFEVVYDETPKGSISTDIKLLLDTETGVLYLCATMGYGGGITPLLDETGSPVRWSVPGTPEEGL